MLDFFSNFLNRINKFKTIEKIAEKAKTMYAHWPRAVKARIAVIMIEIAERMLIALIVYFLNFHSMRKKVKVRLKSS